MMIVAALLPLLLAASAPADAQPTPAAQAAPAAKSTPAELLARELPELPLAMIASADGKVTGTVEAQGAPGFSKQDDDDVIAIPLGTREPLGCRLIRQRVDAGRSLWLTAQALLKQFEVKAIEVTDVVVAGGSPLVFLELVYAPHGADSIGLLKAAVLVHDGHSLLCQHDELGYRESFRRIVRGLSSSLREAGRPASRYVAIAVSTLNGRKVGFSERVVRDREGGGLVIDSIEAVLLAAGPNKLLAEDRRVVEVAAADGVLDEQHFVQTKNGQVVSQVDLTRKEKFHYAYSGAQGGKSIEGRFDTPSGIPSILLVARLLATEVLSGHAKALAVPQYRAAAHPEGPVTLTFRKSAVGKRAVESDEPGGSKATLLLDEAGLVEKLTMPAGKLTLAVERVYTHGKP
jgi:hypothetical protein